MLIISAPVKPWFSQTDRHSPKYIYGSMLQLKINLETEFQNSIFMEAIFSNISVASSLCPPSMKPIFKFRENFTIFGFLMFPGGSNSSIAKKRLKLNKQLQYVYAGLFTPISDH